MCSNVIASQTCKVCAVYARTDPYCCFNISIIGPSAAQSPPAELPPGRGTHRTGSSGGGARGRKSPPPLCHPDGARSPRLARAGLLSSTSAKRLSQDAALRGSSSPPAPRPCPVGAAATERARPRCCAGRARQGSAESWALARIGGGPSSVLPGWLPRPASALGWATSVEGARRPEPASPWCSASAARDAPSSRSCSGRRGARIPSRREPSGCAQSEASGERQKTPSCWRVPPDRFTSGGASETTDLEPQADDCWSLKAWFFWRAGLRQPSKWTARAESNTLRYCTLHKQQPCC